MLLRAVFFGLAILLVPSVAASDQNDERLDFLFETLKAAPSAGDAREIESAIWTIWLDSGRGDVNRLLEDGMVAMSRSEYGAAIDAFGRVVQLVPEFAEGWNKRATAYYLIGDFEASVRDIRRTLALEPRHFGALSGLGLIYLAIGNDEGALRAFEKALEIHPLMPGAKAQIQRIRDRRAGKPI